ncbi:alpha/beta hydrolase [Nocardioides sp. R-C-SC26]|uniref:alpha/beta hydrolase n=1 Tax=Nocardioides sp. R-C-SC26 TaxID=2870414 RepID=UPI001E35A799|nr:alpha/beta hydrolase [Nocardioides sp. R-C-SC26]
MSARRDLLATLDPELRRVGRVLPRGLGLPRTLPLLRGATGVAFRFAGLSGVESHPVSDAVSVRVHRPTTTAPGERQAALLWIHGGGTVIGAAVQEDRYARRLAADVGAVVVAVDYRLAPEHPFPAPVEDCYSALLWTARQPWADPARIAVAGASAGGLLAAATALTARDRGEVTPAALGLVYPMLDDRTTRATEPAGHLVWSARDNVAGWRSYLGGADPEVAAPGRRTDLAGLPPTWVGVGDRDLFHDEDLAFAERLRSAGVATDLHVAPGAFHAFDQIAPQARVAQRFHASLCGHLRTHL